MLCISNVWLIPMRAGSAFVLACLLAPAADARKPSPNCDYSLACAFRPTLCWVALTFPMAQGLTFLLPFCRSMSLHSIVSVLKLFSDMPLPPVPTSFACRKLATALLLLGLLPSLCKLGGVVLGALPLSQHGAPKPGGCALLWRDFGRSSPVSCSLPAEHAHRVVGRTFADFTLVCVYFPARENSPHLVHTVFQAAEAEGKPWLVVGDYNWRASYDHVCLGFEASTFPYAVTTVGHQAAPTRACCSASVSVSNAVVQTCPLPGIPHYQAVVFADAVAPNLCDPAPNLRARRTAVYEWSLPPAPQLPALCQRLISAVPVSC